MTKNKAASETRLRIVRKIRAMRKSMGGAPISGTCLIEWIQAMDDRQNKRKGGLGRVARCLAIVATGLALASGSHVQAQDTPVAPVPIVELLPANVTNAPLSVFTAVLGGLAKRVDVAATYSFKTKDWSDHEAGLSTIYEFYQPQFEITPEFKVQFGAGVTTTYTPAWDELSAGLGGTVALFRFTALQEVVDGHAVTRSVLPRLMAKVFAAVESTITSPIEARIVLGIACPLN